jgi:hypothetical protein
MLRDVKGRLARLFRVLAIALLGVAIWMAYANVFSDDTALRARAGELARTEAGCGDKCKVTGMRGSRGMLEESLEYDMDGSPGWVVTCRRAYVIAGDYTCEAKKR